LIIFRYNGLLDAIQKIHLEEGTKKFYRGFVPTMLGIVPYAGLSFLTYETCKSTYRNWTDGDEPNSIYRMLFGACAGFVGQSTTYPLDIVRRRMQTDGSHGARNPEYRTIISTIRSVLRNEGLISGLYKGLSMNWVKGPIAVGISFTTYDFFHERFQNIIARSQ
jgi:solute carrier family 25 protein 42